MCDIEIIKFTTPVYYKKLVIAKVGDILYLQRIKLKYKELRWRISRMLIWIERIVENCVL